MANNIDLMSLDPRMAAELKRRQEEALKNAPTPSVFTKSPVGDRFKNQIPLESVSLPGDNVAAMIEAEQRRKLDLQESSNAPQAGIDRFIKTSTAVPYTNERNGIAVYRRGENPPSGTGTGLYKEVIDAVIPPKGTGESGKGISPVRPFATNVSVGTPPDSQGQSSAVVGPTFYGDNGEVPSAPQPQGNNRWLAYALSGLGQTAQSSRKGTDFSEMDKMFAQKDADAMAQQQYGDKMRLQQETADPASATSNEFRKALTLVGIPETATAGMSRATMEKTFPSIADYMEKQAAIANAQKMAMMKKGAGGGVGPFSPKKVNENEGKAYSFFNRMKEVEKELTSDVLSSYVPDVSPGAWIQGVVPERLRSDKSKRFMNAAKNWVTAKLRRESGAAISPTEFATDYQVYFPAPGDSPDEIKRKKATRDLITTDMGRESGNAFYNVHKVSPYDEGAVEKAMMAQAKAVPKKSESASPNASRAKALTDRL